jgi:hypothetical protein
MMSINVILSTLSPEDFQRWFKEQDVYLDDLPSVRQLKLYRDWDGLHYLLTGSTKGRGPLAFLSSGGKDVNRGANSRGDCLLYSDDA